MFNTGVQGIDMVPVVFLLATALVLAWVRWKSHSRFHSIPSPAGVWPLNIRFGLPPRAHEVMRRWALDHGELLQIRIGWYNWVVVNSPEAMKEILDRQVSK